MRIFRGLENIHAVIDRHEAEWRHEHGEETNYHDPVSIEEAVRRRLTEQPDEGSGRFAADRFLGSSEAGKKQKDTTPEAVEVIPSKEGRHSWLYNEVMKAVNDAAKGSKNTKIIAVFVPVVQNGREFEDLPADEKITVSPVNEDDVKVEALGSTESTEPETLTEEFELMPETTTEKIETDTELAEAFREMEEKFDEAVAEPVEESETPVDEITEPQSETPVDEILEPQSETPVDKILEPQIETPVDEISEPQEDFHFTDSGEEAEESENTDGEPLVFEEIGGEAEEIPLPEMLDDDDVFDETLTEIQKPDDDDGEVIIIDETNPEDEIEIIPDKKD